MAKDSATPCPAPIKSPRTGFLRAFSVGGRGRNGIPLNGISLAARPAIDHTA
jgi:hypothetical protein